MEGMLLSGICPLQTNGRTFWKTKTLTPMGIFTFQNAPNSLFFTSHYLHVILIRYHSKKKNIDFLKWLEKIKIKLWCCLRARCSQKNNSPRLILDEFLFQEQPTPQVPLHIKCLGLVEWAKKPPTHHPLQACLYLVVDERQLGCCCCCQV
jgi:hypothetical protein